MKSRWWSGVFLLIGCGLLVLPGCGDGTPALPTEDSAEEMIDPAIDVNMEMDMEMPADEAEAPAAE